MKLPPSDKKSDKLKRLDKFIDLKEQCLVSRVERREQYTSNRFFWLYGTDGSYENEDTETGLGPPPGNKIWPHIDQVTSFLYAQDTTRFSTQWGAGVDKKFQSWVPKLNQYVNDEWHRSNTDITFGLGLQYALVYNTCLVKPLWKRNGIQPGLVLPHNFGVLREDVAQLSKQEAFIHCYSITESQFENDFNFLPNFEKIKKLITQRGSSQVEATTGIDKIMMSAQDPLSGGGVGVVDWLAQVSMNYVPRVREALIDMYELYVYDDEIRDFRIVTMADPDVPLLDRPLSVVGWMANECPFVQICPNPDSSYFWGISEVERLTPLQVYRNKCMAQIDHLQELQAHAPSTAVGFPADLLELQYALDTPAGFLNQPDAPNGGNSAKADRIKIELPSDLYARIERIDQEFENMSGLPPITQGKQVSGVRSGGHASELAKLGSSRARKRALIVEDQLEHLATIYLKILGKFDDEELTTDEGEKFIANQMPQDFTVKVDAHSNSPIFVDDLTNLAFALLKAKVITRSRFLDLIQIPMREQLKADLRDIIEPGEAQEAKMKMELERERIGARKGGRPGQSGAGLPTNGRAPS